MRIRHLGASLQDSVESLGGVSVDVNNRVLAFFSDGEELFRGVDRNRANTIVVMSVERLVLRRLEVVGLKLVTNRKNDDVVTQEVQIVAFKRLETH